VARQTTIGSMSTSAALAGSPGARELPITFRASKRIERLLPPIRVSSAVASM